MQSTFQIEKDKQAIRHWLVFFIAILVVSGITAMPAEWELSIATKFFDEDSFVGSWLNEVYHAIKNTMHNYPYLFYGYDWLAFAHIVIAIAFIGPYNDPIKNKWVIEFGAISCVLIIPFALIAGQFRHIPFWWRLADCSFGIFGLIPLGVCYNKIQQIERLENKVEKQFDEFNKLITQ
ncbi:MAG TPA: hypothetical protein VGQ09_20185 [Chitinophagaceae bacterium]|jgi:hypothetical protein|nr:hypothetical protein [Chitinophagaceae bacterium]